MEFELSEFGVDVSTWQPYFVETKMYKPVKNDKLANPTPDQVVEAGFRKCTSGCNSGIFRHEMLGFIGDIIYDLLPVDIIVRTSSKASHFFVKPTYQKVE